MRRIEFPNWLEVLGQAELAQRQKHSFPEQTGDSPRAAPQFRHSLPAKRVRSAHRAGVARACESGNHSDLHPRFAEAGTWGPQPTGRLKRTASGAGTSHHRFRDFPLAGALEGPLPGSDGFSRTKSSRGPHLRFLLGLLLRTGTQQCKHLTRRNYVIHIAPGALRHLSPHVKRSMTVFKADTWAAWPKTAEPPTGPMGRLVFFSSRLLRRQETSSSLPCRFPRVPHVPRFPQPSLLARFDAPIFFAVATSFLPAAG